MEVWNDTQEEMEQWEVIHLDLFFCLETIGTNLTCVTRHLEV